MMKTQVSPQYLREGAIHVTIIEAKSPVHYVIKESPSMNTTSTYASKFLELEESMQKYYRTLEKTFFQLPVKDTILIVEHQNKYFRAKVCSILNLPTSYLIKVYLLDYGKECNVSKDSLFEMHPDFMSVQFQVVDFKLPGLDPMSLVMNSLDLSIEYGIAADWDPSASVYIEGIRKALRNAFVKVEGASKNCIYGTLHVTLPDEEEKCINDELVFKKFASQNPDCWYNITRLSDILSKENISSNANILPSQTSSSEAPLPSCIISEPSPASECSSPKSLKSVKLPAPSTKVPEPLKNQQKSGVAKLRELLRSKKSQKQSKPSTARENEMPFESSADALNTKQKFALEELKEVKAELFEDIKDVCDPANETLQNIEEFSTEREPTTLIEETSKSNIVKDSPSSSKDTVLKTPEKNIYKHDSTSPNRSTFKKFKEMVVKKRAAQKQQNKSQTMIDTACSGSSSYILLQESDSPSDDTCAPLLEKSEKCSKNTDILQIPSESKSTILSQSLPACDKFLDVTSIPQPSKSVPMQDLSIKENLPTVKSEDEISVGSQVSVELEEVFKKVDPSKIKVFVERSKRARALFLAQNKIKQDEHDSDAELAATLPAAELSEPETELAASNMQTMDEIIEVSSSETGTELTSIESNNVVESNKNNSDVSETEFVKQSEIDQGVEPQLSTKPKEIVKLKVDPAKLKAFFERNKKIRALYLAEIKSKQDQCNSSSQSEVTSPSSVVCRSTETGSMAAVSPDMKSVVTPDTNFLNDIIELVDESSGSSIHSPNSAKGPDSDLDESCWMREASVARYDFSSQSLFEKQKVPALCLGEGVPTPVLALNEIAFHPFIKTALETLNFEGPSCIQSIVWPAALRSRCLAAIAPPASGKTVAYLLPIVSNFLNYLYVDSITSKGPIAIIICSSWKKVFHVHNFLHIFMKQNKYKILTCVPDGRSKKSKMTTLMNGCDILIAIPSVILDFFKANSVCVNRCCHFILDDGANLLSSHINEVKSIMGLFGEAIKLRPTISTRLQIVINSERWTKGVASFVDKFLREPLLLFTSFLEAAIYRKIEMFPHICEELYKNQNLVEIVKTCGKRTIVCTQDIKKANEIHCFLLSENIRSFLVTEEMEHFISDGVIQDWKCVNSGLPYCLIITDPALTGITLCDANYIIHYDVPEISRLQFGNRFGLIAEHLQKSEITDCSSHILISETCAKQAVSILKIIKRIGMDVPEDLKDFVNKQEKVVDNADAPLCKYFKAYGLCKLPHCDKRHHVNPVVDQPKVIFREGQVEGKVMYVFDASHFCVRILNYTPPDCHQPLSLSAEYAEMGLKLKTIYSVKSNRKVIDCPVIGGNYITGYGEFFYRVRVIDILRPSEASSRIITLLFRDDGIVEPHKGRKLYEDITSDDLPPPHAVEVFICNVCTPDSCVDWYPLTNFFVQRSIQYKAIHGKIALCLGEVLWLHPMVLREKLMFSNDYLNVLSVSKSLLDAGLALENEDHLPLLYKACENKIQLPCQKSSKPLEDTIYEDLKNQVSYAFLELNVYEDVYISIIVSPHQIYVQRAKFVECLNELMKQISAQIDAKKLKKCSTLQNGMYCIAPCSVDNRYYRALITNVSSDSDDVQVFFVDFGDSCSAPKNLIFNLPSEFALLPFQAIQCELDGICAPHGGWSDKAVQFLEDITVNESNDMMILEIKAYTKLTSYDAGNRYKVDIFYGEKTLSELLLSEGLVDPADKFVAVEVPIGTTENKEVHEDDSDEFYLTSDEDLPAENKEHHILFCAALSKMLLQNKSKTDAVNEAKDELHKNKHKKSKDKEISINKDAEEPIKEESSVLKSPILALQRLLNFKKKEEESKKTRPTVSWWDSLEEVHMLLKLKDIQLYELDIKDKSFLFKTSLGGVDYYIEEYFYDAVLSKECIEKNGPEGLSIVLKKQVEERWPCLIKANKKVPYIKYDLEHIDVSDSDDIPEDNITIPPVNVPVEEDDSTDDENDVPRWKKLAEFKDPYNPID